MKHSTVEKKSSRAFIIACAVILVILAGVTLSFLSGVRMFIIQTPSMGTYSPVGSLVVSTPTTLGEVNKGEMMLFHPPGSKDTFFHRVVEVNPRGFKTKGDINGTVDPWTVPNSSIIGKELFHVHNLGFLFRVLPFIMIGGFALQIITRHFGARYYRFPIRVLGWTALVAVGAYFSRPFFNAQLISQNVTNHHGTTAFVATGIFGMQGTAVKGTTGHGEPGQVITVFSNYADKNKLYNVELVPHLSILEWFILVGAILLPVILCTVYAIYAHKKGLDVMESSTETVESETTENTNLVTV